MTTRLRDNIGISIILSNSISGGPSPTMSPALNLQEISGGGGGEERWRHFDNSVNAVSFGFVATAILISMFLVMAIFERFLRPTSSFFSGASAINANGNANAPDDAGPPRSRRRATSASASASAYAYAYAAPDDLEAHRRNFSRKLDYPSSPKMSIYAKGVSVLMPGNDIPTFIAHPAPPPAPCPPERILWPLHHPTPIAGSASSSS